MYYQLEEAIRELEKRQKNDNLKKRVDDLLGNCPILEGKTGVILRQVATCRYEDILFKNLCLGHGLKPFWMEYYQDLFCAANPAKSRLIKLKFFNGVGKKKGIRLGSLKLVDNIQSWEGKPLCEVKTIMNNNLVDFHHSMRHYMGWNWESVDASKWVKNFAGGSAEEYYRILLLAFVTRSILFESFESPGFYELERFKKKIVIPAWRWVSEEFAKPLIVLHPGKSQKQEERMLNWYPGMLMDYVDNS